MAIDSHLATANVSDLWHVLLAGAAWWTLGSLTLPVIAEAPWVRARLHRGSDSVGKVWTAVNLAAGAAVWVVWLAGDMSRVEVDDMMSLRDPGTVALIWLYLGWAFTGGVIVMAAALITLPDPEAPRVTAALLLGIGICGVGISVTSAAYLVADADDLEARFPAIMGL
ncbi:hypothetical protein ACFRAM_28655, partial [Paenibacillus sp. NPDC056722]|uniref:hypothetical protein n=1 Tax=Paenibacillus sp. NPDC056722 TaxID=3345924 RepID=UPI003692020F